LVSVPRAFIDVVDVKTNPERNVALKPCIIEFKVQIFAVVKLEADL